MSQLGKRISMKCKSYNYTLAGGPGSVVGIATGYGLDGPGIDSVVICMYG